MLTTHNWFVVGMGIMTVFLGLICIIILCKLIGLFCNIGKSGDKPQGVAIITDTQSKPIENRQEIIAAVSCALAEELGKDVSAIRILSFKKL